MLIRTRLNRWYVITPFLFGAVTLPDTRTAVVQPFVGTKDEIHEHWLRLCLCIKLRDIAQIEVQ